MNGARKNKTVHKRDLFQNYDEEQTTLRPTDFSWIPTKEMINTGICLFESVCKNLGDYVLAFYNSDVKGKSGWYPGTVINAKQNLIYVEFEPDTNLNLKFSTTTSKRIRLLIPRQLVSFSIARRSHILSDLFQSAIGIDSRETSEDAISFCLKFAVDRNYLPWFINAAKLGWEPIDIIGRNALNGNLRGVFQSDLALIQLPVKDLDVLFWRATKMDGIPLQYASICRNGLRES